MAPINGAGFNHRGDGDEARNEPLSLAGELDGRTSSKPTQVETQDTRATRDGLAPNNGLRWNCRVRGCFNENCRPKLEVFAGCFPRKINFGDVDGIVELNGRFLLLEWKGPGGTVKLAQLRSYLAFTRQSDGNVVFVVGGAADTMRVSDFAIVWQGKFFPSTPGNLDDLKQRLRAWAAWAESRRRAAA
jgi:hypothetical protein